jgi:tetratricopeptide (TPR) repeat protein
MSDQAPDLWERFRAWVFGRFGIPGLVVLACASAVLFAWTQWDKVSTWPGVSAMVELISRAPVPKTDPERFSVLVAKLNRDANDALGNQIFEVLKEFPGIQALPLDRTLARDTRMTEVMEAEAGEVARRCLQESGASVLIWGSVLDREHKIAKLFLTTSSAAQQKGKEGKQYQPEIGTTIRLPDVFWSDLAQVLLLAIASRDAEFQEGSFVADRLPPFIAGVRRLLNESRDRPGWDTDARGSTRVILADALSTLGHQSEQNAPLQEAVEAYRAALQEYTRKRMPLQWARTQNNLGITLARLARLDERESGTARLEEAVAAFRAALQEYTRKRMPLQWAWTQTNLGTALSTLGDQSGQNAPLQEAVEAFRAALQEYTRKRMPLDWAMTQNNLGITLARLARLDERESGTARLEEAVAAFRAALEELPRERVPLDWAATQTNLGTALGRLGNQSGQNAPLQEAVEARERRSHMLQYLWSFRMGSEVGGSETTR